MGNFDDEMTFKQEKARAQILTDPLKVNFNDSHFSV